LTLERRDSSWKLLQSDQRRRRWEKLSVFVVDGPSFHAREGVTLV
jgi:hypothetical protein